MIEKVYHVEIDTVCVILIVDVYVMLCVHVVLFYAYEGRGWREPMRGRRRCCFVCVCVFMCVYFEGRGQRELVGVKIEYDIVCC